MVGAASDNQYAGAAYIHNYKPDLEPPWVQIPKVTAFDGASGDGFGLSAAVAGIQAVIGAPGGFDRPGAAYVYRKVGSTYWIADGKLVAPDGQEGDSFGHSVAVSGDLLAIGAQRDDSDRGSVHAALVRVRRFVTSRAVTDQRPSNA